MQTAWTISEDCFISKFSNAFKGLGCLPGSDEIAIDHSVSPVKHVSRYVPVSMKPMLKEKFEKLVSLQVVKEPTD